MKAHMYTVISPVYYCSSYNSPPEPGVDSVEIVCNSSEDAKCLALRSGLFSGWIRNARREGVTPFSGLTVSECICPHGKCYCPDCRDCPCLSEEGLPHFLLDKSELDKLIEISSYNLDGTIYPYVFCPECGCMDFNTVYTSFQDGVSTQEVCENCSSVVTTTEEHIGMKSKKHAIEKYIRVPF
jgi:hypothetical protein